MSSWHRIKLIAFKELRQTYLSPVFYIVASCFCLILGWIFFNLLVGYLESVHNHMANQSNIDFAAGVLKSFFTNMNFLFVLITPVFTMKTLASEKERGTFDLLMSCPLKPWELIIGKWLSSWVSMLSLLVLSLVIPLILAISNLPLGEVVVTGYMGILFNMTLYSALGIFFSTLSSNQNIAALLSLVGIMFLWMIPWASQNSHNLMLIEIYRYIGVMTHFGFILNEGIISSSHLFYYFSTSLLFLGAAILILYRRRKA